MSDPMPIKEMYSQQYRLNTSGIDGYDSPRKYLDPLQQIKERSYLNIKKGQKVGNQKIPPRPNYLDQATKQASFLPPPGKYHTELPWPEKKANSLKKEYPKKMTYLDEVIRFAKKQKLPAPGQYNTFKSQKEIETELAKLKTKKVEFKTKINFLDQVQLTSTLTPGPGNYNPRNVVSKVKQKMMPGPEDWRRKSELLAKKKPQKAPDMRTYSPIPVDMQLFGSPRAKNNTVKSLWGKQERFKTQGSPLPGLSKDKSLTNVKSALPGPGQYNMIHKWIGKQTSSKTRIPRDYMDVMTKPTSKSVYY